MSELFSDAQVPPLMLHGQEKGQEQSVDAEQQEKKWEEELKNAKEAKKIEDHRKSEERRTQQEHSFSKVTELIVKELLLRVLPRSPIMMLLRTTVEPLTEESQDLPYLFSYAPSSADFISSIFVKRSASELEDDSSNSEIEAPLKCARGSQA